MIWLSKLYKTNWLTQIFTSLLLIMSCWKEVKLIGAWKCYSESLSSKPINQKHVRVHNNLFVSCEPVGTINFYTKLNSLFAQSSSSNGRYTSHPFFLWTTYEHLNLDINCQVHCTGRLTKPQGPPVVIRRRVPDGHFNAYHCARKWTSDVFIPLFLYFICSNYFPSYRTVIYGHE